MALTIYSASRFLLSYTPLWYDNFVMKIAFEERKTLGKKVNALRSKGFVPVVCYGQEQESKPYTVIAKELLKLLASDAVVVEGGGALSGKQVILQDIDLHPVTDEPVHADFLFVDATREVEHEVPVRVEGEAPAVRSVDGQMVVALDRIVVRALPQHIPGHFTADVSDLGTVGSRLLVSDMPLPEGVTLITNPDEIVVSIVEQSQEEEEEQTVDEDYLSNIEVTGKGGKKEEDEEASEGGEPEQTEGE